MPAEREYVTLLCRLNPANNGFHSFYILPRVDRARQCRLKEDDKWLNTGSRLAESGHQRTLTRSRSSQAGLLSDPGEISLRCAS